LKSDKQNNKNGIKEDQIANKETSISSIKDNKLNNKKEEQDLLKNKTTEESKPLNIEIKDEPNYLKNITGKVIKTHQAEKDLSTHEKFIGLGKSLSYSNNGKPSNGNAERFAKNIDNSALAQDVLHSV